MSEHKYSFFARFVYRYANLPISVLLLIYLVFSLAATANNKYFIIPAFINAAVLYLMNRNYLRNNKTMPYKINVNNTTIKVSDFAGRRKDFSFSISQIKDIAGGIFAGAQTKPIFIFVEGEKYPVSFNAHISGFNELLTAILKNVDKNLYEKLMSDIRSKNEKYKELLAKRKPAKKRAKKR